MEEREVDICFDSEVWEKAENKKHKQKIESMLEIKGISYISTPRPGKKRGGGAGICVNTEHFQISKLNIQIPKPLEIVWGLLKPKKPIGRINKIIVCSFYSPPWLYKNAKLVDHMTETLQSLLRIHTGAGIIISGDRNIMEISALVSIDPSLRQVVKLPTRGPNVLDVVLPNLGRYYSNTWILPPVLPDNATTASPSDHNGVLVKPLTNILTKKNTKEVRKIRPLPDSLIDAFGQKLTNQNFAFDESLSSSEIVESFQSTLQSLIEETFPEKEILVLDDDLPYFTESLRKLKRLRQREYQKHGKSNKYLELKASFDERKNIELEKYKVKILNEVSNGKRGSIYPTLKKLGLRPGSDEKRTFQLSDHIEKGFTPTQSVEAMAQHFSLISQEYQPLSMSNLPVVVQTFLKNDESFPPELHVYDVYLRIKKAKKPNSQVPGDLPPKIVKKYPELLANPATMIFNKITKSASYPSCWKTEFQVPIPKIEAPESVEDIRNIAKTSFLSKVYESFIGEWLLKFVKPYLDPNQCGIKGLSTTHYLIRLLQFVHETLDQKQSQAILAVFFDLSKAFNRVDHSLVIQDLYDMHTPSWLLRIIYSYLQDRSMVLTYKGVTSTVKLLPGGGPQGAFLGGLIFMIKFNGAFLRPSVPRPMPLSLAKSKSKSVKFVDDGTVAASVDLKSALIQDPVQRPRPLCYQERTEHVLPKEANLLHYVILDTEKFATENNLVLNKAKTDIMKFNPARKRDFPIELEFSDGSSLDQVKVKKLVGVFITDNLKWERNTSYICEKARKKLWLLRRMKQLNLNTSQLFDAYTKEVRSILEMAVLVWHSSLTQKQSNSIERIQKVAFKLILGEKYENYENDCQFLGAQTLFQRRVNLCKSFARKNLKSEHSFFEKYECSVNTRSRNRVVKEFHCNTSRYSKSSLPYLAKLINDGV